jgi:hypothetical protein
MAGGHAAMKALQNVDVLDDRTSQRRAGVSSLETHSQWCAHEDSCRWR